MTVRALLLFGALAVVGSCKESTQPDPPGPPASFVIVSGDQQADTVAQELPQPLVARITDAAGRPVPNAVVSFVVTSGGGSVFAPAVQANAQGIVQNRWTLGTSTALAQEVEVRSVNPNTGAPIVFGRFRATARPDRPATLTKIAGDGQHGVAATRLPNDPRVRAADQYGNPTPGITVAWTVESGGGSVNAATTTTDADGYASVQWTLGPTAGQGQVTATVASVPPASFTAFAAAGAPAIVRVNEGNGQEARVGTVLPIAVSIVVTDAHGNPVPGVVPTWTVQSGSGMIVSRSPAATDANGVARADWRLGTVAGSQAARAAVGSLPVVEFAASATPDPVTALVAVSGVQQSAVVGTTLTQPLVVRALDQYGNAVPNVSIAFAGSGSFSASTVNTSSDGEAQAMWTLPTSSGAHTATASGAGLSVQFAATALPGSPAGWSKTGGDAQSGLVGSPLSQLLAVRIVDSYGNPVPDVTVTWTPNDGGTVAPSTSVTTSTGDASTRRTLGTVPRPYPTRANAVALPELVFSATALAGPAATLEKISGDDQSGALNQPLAAPVVVRVLDPYGNPVSGETVTWTVTGGGGSLQPATSTTGADGTASSTWTLGGTGANRVQASNGPRTVLFTATVIGLSAARVDPGNFRDRVGAIGQSETLVAVVRDASGVPVANATVDWILTSGTGSLSAATSISDASGSASIAFTPGTVAGSNFIEARVAGATPGRYLVWTRALAPARVVALQGDNQSAVVGQPMPSDIRARVEDQYGNGVYGDTVRFTVVAGGGYVERTFLVTDSLGNTTSTRWIAGAPGTASLRVSASGVETSLSATVQASSGPSLFIENQPLGRTHPIGGTGAQTDPVTVRLIDAAGNPIVGATVTWTGWGMPRTTTTNSEGRSTSTVGYYDGSPGVQQATISAAGVTATLYIVLLPSGANVSAGPSPPPGILSARVGTRIEAPIIVRCSDRQGAPSTVCSVRVSGLFGEGFGGTLLPAPGYRPAGERAYYWILPPTPGTYYAYTQAPAGPGHTDARALP